MSIHLRKATLEDLKSILELVHSLAAYEKEPDAVTATIGDYHEAFQKGIFEAIVAVEKEKIIGMALYYMTFSTWKGKCMYLEDFYVQPEYRDKGIGQRLFDAYIEAAIKSGARQAKWQILDWNEPALAFYRKNKAVIETNWWNGKLYFDI